MLRGFESTARTGTVLSLLILVTAGCQTGAPPTRTGSATPTPITTPSPAIDLEALSYSPLMKKTLETERGKSNFLALPRSVQPAVAQLNEDQVRELKSGTQGASQFGFITVNHRSAFINGSVAGKSVWGTIKDKITTAAQKGKMTESEAVELNKLIELSIPLTPRQRAKMLDFMDTVEIDQTETASPSAGPSPSP